jgi:GntR family transcriptional regulator
MEAHNWQSTPLYEVLENECGLKVERAEEFLEPVNLQAEEAQLLRVETGMAAFRVERLTYDDKGRIFERRISLIRGDRYRFRVDLPKIELGT